MNKVSIRGVVIGGVVDVILSGILGIPLIIYVLATRGLAGLPKTEMQRAVVSAIHASTSLYAVQLLIGSVCTVLGAFLAARIAKHDHVLNGLLASLICVAIGVYSVVAGKSSEPLIIQLTLLGVITPLCGLAGGYLARPRTSANAA